MDQPILIIGAGMAGLFTALALGSRGHAVTVLERDPPPPDGGADAAFADWSRRGVGHLRHSHAFLARLRSILIERHPALHQRLLAAGCQELSFASGLSPRSAARYKPEPGDADLTVLTSRRTTLELVLRQYVAELPTVTLRSGVNVAGVAGAVTDGVFVCEGLKLDDGEVLQGIVVDAGGRSSQAFDWLDEAGIKAPEESEDAGILYYTRHYRLRPGMEPPERGAIPGAGDLGFIKYGVFPADNGCFSITLAVPEIEETLRLAVMRPETFDALCTQMPGVAGWIDPARSEAVSKVFGMGDLKSRWRDMAPGGRPLALNLFPIGDGLVRTNPLYGRGCSFAAVSGELVAETLTGQADPSARATAFAARVRSELGPYFEDMRSQDRAAIRRARNALNPSYRPGFKARAMKSFTDDGIAIALRRDPALLREFMRGFHMLEDSRAWLKRPANAVKVLGAWATPRGLKKDWYPPRLGPGRADMLAAVGIDPAADPRRLGFA
ncbi:FAD-dependent oxidoreductase [Caulobacter sp. NIBR1757]|uniref:FAD-dependent oxidoreductase n=1 Tax=Caulobacter sp. NIBR1757 TaxID=3016000 RepID=UPI0022F090FA|nr:FAD-dependent oxidoreductase [Caulobacter sp. NIBR1757]WGM37187.1 tRNA 5-methylaminomethyl-2-thiouridine biosynthesis bifunctional protein MnmC [Caulobacter sp. NIBR1757]